MESRGINDFMNLYYFSIGLNYLKQMLSFFLILLAISVLVWQEKETVNQSMHFHEGMNDIVELSSPNTINSEHEGKLVHVTGVISMRSPLKDKLYGVSIKAVRLKRRVQMYQWVEIFDDQKNPLYLKLWKDKHVNSDEFLEPYDHENPKSFSVNATLQLNPQVSLGKFTLERELKEKFGTYVPFTSEERPTSGDIKMHMGLYYHSRNIWSPTIGDTRVQFSFAGPTGSQVSVIARQKKSSLEQFVTTSGKAIALVHEGRKSHVDIFTEEQKKSNYYIFLIRVICWVAAIVGFSLVLQYRSKDNKTRKFRTVKFSLIISTSILLVTMSVPWFYHSPLYSFSLLSLSVLFIGFVIMNIWPHKRAKDI